MMKWTDTDVALKRSCAASGNKFSIYCGGFDISELIVCVFSQDPHSSETISLIGMYCAVGSQNNKIKKR